MEGEDESGLERITHVEYFFFSEEYIKALIQSTRLRIL